MDNTVDLLQIKIERAKEKLPEDTLNAIALVDWKAAILGLRAKKGYNFEQLADLELETELVLCGLVNPEDYPREIQNRMKISKMEAGELVEEMNNLVFKKIKEELIKSTERKKIFQTKSIENDKKATQVLEKAGIDIVSDHSALGTSDTGGEPVPVTESREDLLKKVENPELIKKPEPVIPLILQQKLSGPVQMPKVTTEHTMENITAPVPPVPASYPVKKDPYRLSPED
jgi:hypothetical protein